MMKSEEYKKYLKRIKRNNILVLLTQILIVVIFIVFWQIMADKNMVDTEKLFSNLQELKNIMSGYDYLDQEQEEAIQAFFQNGDIIQKDLIKALNYII